MALISNPENPRDWSSEAAEQFDLPLAWLDRPEIDLDTTRERMIEMGRHYKTSATKRAIGRIVDETTQAFGLAQDQPILPDQLDPFASLAAWRVAHLLTRMPESQPLTREQIARMLGDL